MQTSRWVLSTFVAVAVALAGASWWSSGRGGRGAPAGRAGGHLAPLLPGALGPWRETGRIPASSLGSDGPVVALDVGGGAAFLAQHNHWYRVSGEGLSGPFGDATRGAPNWIERALDIAWHDGHVYLIDGGRRQISVWTESGERLREIALAEDPSTVYEPDRLAIDAAGRLYVVGHLVSIHAPGEWLILRLNDDSAAPDTLWREPAGSRPGTAANIPRLAVRDDGTVLVATALDYRLHWLNREGAVTGSATRPDPPLWPVPDSIREEHEALLTLLPPSMRAAYALPPHVPPVHGIALRPDGTAIARTARTLESSHLEWLGSDGVPLGRLTDAPVFEPIHIGDSTVYRIREDVGGVVVESAPLALE